MFLQGRTIIVWLSWLVGGICGVVILLVIICYCRLMPRHQKSFDEQYLKENYAIKENHAYTSQESYRLKHAEAAGCRAARPASYAGAARVQHVRHDTLDTHTRDTHTRDTHTRDTHTRDTHTRDTHDTHVTPQYASSTMLDEIDGASNMDALKTRSLPAFLRPKPRPLSTEDDLHQLYAKVNLSKKYKSRMRSEHAAIIALSKSHSQFLDAHAVIVYEQRTAL